MTWAHKQKPTQTPNILAMETSVTDRVYEADGGNEELKAKFFSNLKSLIPPKEDGEDTFQDNPRAGDNIMVFAEDFDHALVKFASEHQLINDKNIDFSDTEKLTALAEKASIALFGNYTLEAGGSLANTFDAMVHSRINDKPLINGTFITAVGEGEPAQVFLDSLEGHVAAAQGQHRHMAAHVVPMGKDRIIVATPSLTNDSSQKLTADLLTSEHLNANTDMVMLGGYMMYTTHGKEVFNHALERIEALNEERKEQGKPSIKLVLTAAAHPIAENPDFIDIFKRATKTTDVIVHANTGEFRRLHSNDDAWRKPHNTKWDGMTSHEEEDAKKADQAYQEDKQAANDDTIENFAVPMAQNSKHKLSFVVTNGSKSTYHINDEGYRRIDTDKLDKKHIVNTVGAGDSFAAGWELGEALNLKTNPKLVLASTFARTAIQQDKARLNANEEQSFDTTGKSLKAQGAIATLDNSSQNREILQSMQPKQRAL